MAEVTQWEYKIAQGPSEEYLNKLGQEGWEMTGTKESSGNTQGVYLKRPKQPQRPAPSDGYGYSR